MGYDTYYDLEIYRIKNDGRITFDPVPIKDWPSLNMVVEENSDIWFLLNEGDGDMRWYEHEIDLCELSKNHKDLMFKLKGDGDNSLDIWQKCFNDGLCWSWQLEVVIPEISEMSGLMRTLKEKLGVIPKESSNEGVHQSRELEAGRDTECVAPAPGNL